MSRDGVVRYVVDANIVLKWLLSEEDSPRALALRRLAEEGAAELLAPAFCRVEVANALRMSVVRRRITESEGQDLLELVQALPLVSFADDASLPAAWTIAREAGVTLYDALYAALAADHLAPLLTADAPFAQKLRARWPEFGVVTLAEIP